MHARHLAITLRLSKRFVLLTKKRRTPNGLTDDDDFRASHLELLQVSTLSLRVVCQSPGLDHRLASVGMQRITSTGFPPHPVATIVWPHILQISLHGVSNRRTSTMAVDQAWNGCIPGMAKHCRRGGYSDRKQNPKRLSAEAHSFPIEGPSGCPRFTVVEHKLWGRKVEGSEEAELRKSDGF